MQIKYMIDGTTVRIIKLSEDTTYEKLPPRVYTVRYSEFTGFYLDINNDELAIPRKIYGTTEQRACKCINTYKDRSTSTGILMTGDKGTGKSLLMSTISNKVVKELKLPVIQIKEPFSGTAFEEFIESIGECCIIFDEFGKVYAQGERANTGPQKKLLSLLDGANKTKRMLLFTENSIYDINEFMLNRPSRIYYHFKYNKIDEASIKEFCEDYKVSVKIMSEIVEISRKSKMFSFDMLQAIVEEYIRTNDAIDVITEELNIDITQSYNIKLEVIKILDKDGNEVEFAKDKATIERPDADNRHSIVWLKHKNRDTLKTDEFLLEDTDDEENKYFYIMSDNLVYTKDDMEVYKADDYMVTTKVVKKEAFNYIRAF